MTKEEWQIMKQRDQRYDGQLYCGLIDRKTVCLPSCPLRVREIKNVIVFHSLDEAAAQGYRPCPHCRPDQPGWKGAKYDLAEAAKQYIEAHSAEKFSLQALSGALYINGSYLLRVFKAHTGCTLLWYHNHVRCEKAKELLRVSSISVSEAGERAGFTSSSHFSHVFKKMTGVTPTQYRNDWLRHLEES